MGSEPALTVYHGGGFICGSIASHNRLCPRLIRVAGCTITSVDYRLAPEHRYPAAFEDAYGALNGVAGHGQDHGIDVFRIAVAHDSAEAVLAAVASISARDEMGPALRRHLLIYSGTDLEVDTQSRRQFESGYSSKAGHPDVRRGLCAGAARAVRPWPLTGLAASRAGLPRPRAAIIPAECDPLREEGEAYAARLAVSGVAVEIVRHRGSSTALSACSVWSRRLTRL